MRRFFRASSIGWVVLIIFLGLPLTVHAGSVPFGQGSGYSVVGPPTVSASFINQVLAAYHSPAAGKGQALYDDGAASGIDPVFALAFFMHESSFGTAGIARQTLSLGNLRCIPTTACQDGFAAFPSWESGFEAWYQLIRNLYVGTWGLTTVEQIIPRYAPASDHNNEAAYISAVEIAVDTWRGEQVAVPQQPGTTPSDGTIYPPDGYRILGKPTVSAAFIEHILTIYHSPAAGKGQTLYNDGVKYGIDPAVALAFFMHDSIFGTVGLARVTLALGVLPAPATATCHCQAFHGYRRYAGWEDGFQDWYSYIHDRYVTQLGLTTIGQIVPVYTQVKDAEAINAFIKSVEHRLDIWRSEQERAS